MLKRFSILFILLLLCVPAQAAMDVAPTPFGQIPVLHEGRLKPLRRLAEVSLRQICDCTWLASARDSTGMEELNATNWLALLLFEPAQTQDLPMFRVDNAAVAQLLQLPEKPHALYTYQELAVALTRQAQALNILAKRPSTELSRDEKALVKILENIALYQQLTHAFSLVAPLAIARDDAGLQAMHINIGQNPMTYLQLQKYQKPLIERAHLLAKQNPAELSDNDLAVARLAQILDELHNGAANNAVLRILPPAWQQNGDTWITPWQAITAGQGGPNTLAALQQWQAMLRAYQADDKAGFSAAVKNWQQTLQQNNVSPARQLRWQAETIYLAWPWLFGAGIAYTIILLALTVIPALRQESDATFGNTQKIKIALHQLQIPAQGRDDKMNKAATLLSWLLVSFGILQHAIALGLRMLIMGRPPVSNLYESIIFVAFIAVSLGVLAQLRKRLNILLIPALAIALILLVIDQFFIGDGDNLSPLIAVLNTKFWLATHVVCITLGYTACLLTAAYAHLLLVRHAWQRAPLEIKLLKPLLHISLLLVVTGTLLGGIWADQSWGRFWGWDPKENGALLISIWLLWLQHGAVTGQLKNFGLTAGTAFLAPVVALSWFGVNLLGVGLHSYGFSSQTAWGLFIFIAAEILFIAVLAWRHKKVTTAPV